MQILLDECLPRDLGKSLTPHQVTTVPEKGWGGISNGKLLDLAQKNGFQVFVTVDQNLAVQNPTAGTQLIIIVLCTPSNKLSDLHPLASKVIALLSQSPSPGVYSIGT